MKAIVVRQPWASLIAHGIKTIETRGFRPLSSLAGGDPLAIVAGKALPPAGTAGEAVGGWQVVRPRNSGFTRSAAWLEAKTGQLRPCAIGAVVAVVTYDMALPVVHEDEPEAEAPCLTVGPFSLGLWRSNIDMNAVTDQIPLGDFAPGRTGWLLSDPQRLTCPVPCPAKRPDGSRTVMQGVFTLPDDVLARVLPQLTQKNEANRDR